MQILQAIEGRGDVESASGERVAADIETITTGLHRVGVARGDRVMHRAGFVLRVLWRVADRRARIVGARVDDSGGAASSRNSIHPREP
jgi:hypothetical protein